MCGGDAVCLQYFTDLPDETGQNSLVIILDGMDLEVGDEVGLFDTDGVIDGDGNTGEILVGAAVWTGEQLNAVGIESVDLTQFGGPILPGYVTGNSITYKVWKASEGAVYSAEATYQTGTGTWGDILTAVDMLYPIFSVTQEIVADPFMLNLLSLNVIPESTEISDILSDNSILLAANDEGQYYVPAFGVNQIGSLNVGRGLQVFLNGAGAQTVTVEGLPAELGPIEINPFQVNVISYIPEMD
jgi:hypothetical protein